MRSSCIRMWLSKFEKNNVRNISKCNNLLNKLNITKHIIIFCSYLIFHFWLVNGQSYFLKCHISNGLKMTRDYLCPAGGIYTAMFAYSYGHFIKFDTHTLCCIRCFIWSIARWNYFWIEDLKWRQFVVSEAGRGLLKPLREKEKI